MRLLGRYLVELVSLVRFQRGGDRQGDDALRAAREPRQVGSPRRQSEAVARLQRIPGGWAPPPLLAVSGRKGQPPRPAYERLTL